MYSIRNCWRRPVCKVALSMGPWVKESPGFGTEIWAPLISTPVLLLKQLETTMSGWLAVKVEIANCGGVKIISYFDRAKHGIASSQPVQYQVDGAICIVERTRSSIPSPLKSTKFTSVAGHIYAVAGVSLFRSSCLRLIGAQSAVRRYLRCFSRPDRSL